MWLLGKLELSLEASREPTGACVEEHTSVLGMQPKQTPCCRISLFVRTSKMSVSLTLSTSSQRQRTLHSFVQFPCFLCGPMFTLKSIFFFFLDKFTIICSTVQSHPMILLDGEHFYCIALNRGGLARYKT